MNHNIVEMISCSLALQHEKEETEFSNASAVETVDITRATDSSSQVADQSIDMSLYVLSTSPAKRISLKAGNWIGYQDKVLSNSSSRLISVIRFSKLPR